MAAFPNWEIELRDEDDAYEQWKWHTVLWVHALVIDSRDPQRKREVKITHQFVVHEHLIDNEQRFVAWVHQCLRQVAVHELDEFFTYNGELVSDPHDRS